ncbi:MAG: hypothetical protein ACRDQD_20890, partial [Nocardioidaceae bacterium]
MRSPSLVWHRSAVPRRTGPKIDPARRAARRRAGTLITLASEAAARRWARMARLCVPGGAIRIGDNPK